MPELRWILIFVGLLLVAGLWFWETQRRREQSRDESREADAEEPGHGDGQAGSKGGKLAPEAELPSIRASRRKRGDYGRNPPVVEFPGGMEPELARADRDAGFVPPNVPYRKMQEERLGDIPEDLRNLPPDAKAEAAQRQPWVRTQPLDRREMQAKNGGAGATPGAQGQTDVAEGSEPEPAKEPGGEAASQRIVALRLIAERGRWPGRTVIEALQAEGLSHGKYSIYHRERDDGKSIFFVASMVEPGSFELDEIDSLSYPGISIFSVIPGPIDAPTTFDLMLATARRLAERLSGHLQDEQGSTLTAQRILNLREELVHFEHVARRVQKR